MTGAVLFVTLLYVEVLTGVPLVRAFVGRLSPRVDRQMALVFLLFNLVTAMLFTLAQPLVCDLLERWLPADAEEDLSKTQYLYEEALDEPATALDLIEKEQLASSSACACTRRPCGPVPARPSVQGRCSSRSPSPRSPAGSSSFSTSS